MTFSIFFSCPKTTWRIQGLFKSAMYHIYAITCIGGVYLSFCPSLNTLWLVLIQFADLGSLFKSKNHQLCKPISFLICNYHIINWCTTLSLHTVCTLAVNISLFINNLFLFLMSSWSLDTKYKNMKSATHPHYPPVWMKIPSN